MRLFEYSYHISYGNGCGIVIAESLEEAIEMMKQDAVSIKIRKATFEETYPDFEITEIDLSVKQIVDYSYEE